MAASVSTVGAVNRTLLNLNGSGAGASAPSSAFFGTSLKKVIASRVPNGKVASGSFKIVAAEKEIEETQQTDKDRWKGLAYDISDDQQDITRGKGMVDPLFQAPMEAGTHYAVMSSYEYLSTGLRQYDFDNMKDGFYIAPAFMDKLVVHITKNFMSLPNIKVPLILGIWGGKGQGKSFQCELVFAKMGINPIMMSAGELESGNAGEPAKLIRQRYREAADLIKKGKMCALFINDLDAGAGRLGGTTQYTVNNQMVNATLMNIADNPTNVQLPGMYNKEENPRVPIIVTGNDFSTLYAPLIRDGRMEKFYWAPTRDDRVGVCKGIFRTDGVPDEDVVKLVDTFPGQSIDFFGALRARVYDDEVRKWISGVGVDAVGKRLVNSKEEMRRNGLKPDIITYSSLLRGLGHEGKVDKAIKIFRDMEGLGIKPNAITYNSIMFGLCKAQQTSRAIDFLAYMVEQGCRPTEVTYTILIEGIADEGLAEEALELLNVLCSRGLVKKSSAEQVAVKM